MGIKYLGIDGIRERMVQIAIEKGLPPNSYFNDDSLIEATEEKVFSRILQRVENADTETDKLFRGISSRLQKGDILFSTESSGHTGIIANHASKWTLINSGELDNTVSGLKHPTKGIDQITCKQK